MVEVVLLDYLSNTLPKVKVTLSPFFARRSLTPPQAGRRERSRLRRDRRKPH